MNHELFYFYIKSVIIVFFIILGLALLRRIAKVLAFLLACGIFLVILALIMLPLFLIVWALVYLGKR